MPWDSKPVCPKCHHYNRHFYGEPEDGKVVTHTCTNCNVKFRVEYCVSLMYSTSPIDEESKNA